MKKNDNDRDNVVKIFTRLMLQGKIRPAVIWLTERVGGVLDPGEKMSSDTDMSVLDMLKLKHPDSKVPSQLALYKCKDDEIPVWEDVEVNGSHVLQVARMIQGGAGPGGSDSTHWQDSLMRFGAHSERLRESVAELIKGLANSIIPWQEIRALMANRLIALDKCPGVRPVGIGEALRRILGKVMVMVTRYEVEEVAGVAQLCAGVRSGIEGAIHTMSDLFDDNKMEGWGVLLVDARNAFNSVNRVAILWNARILWPRCSRFIFNTYRGWAPLVIAGGKSIVYSKEGVTQGDPLSMFLYAIGTLPLIHSLKSQMVTQVWYADDASAGGTLRELRNWFVQLVEQGPLYGYFPEPTKSYLIVDEKYTSIAGGIFEEFGVRVVQSRRMLGGIIGNNTGKKEFLNQLNQRWQYKLETLTEIAEQQPQAAYTALVKSLQNEWAFVQKVVKDCEEQFQEIENAIAFKVLPAIFGNEISGNERKLFSLPARMGGLGVEDPREMSSSAYRNSKKSCEKLIEAIRGTDEFVKEDHMELIDKTRKESRKAKEERMNNELDEILPLFDQEHQRAINRTRSNKISTWLTVLPVARYNFDLAPQEFRDALAIRYRKPLLRVPECCDGCGSVFDLSHALDCTKGGLVIRRHNEIRDAIADVSSMVWGQVKKEPVVREPNNTTETPALIADLSIRGVWTPQELALLDVRVIDTDAKSYGNRSPEDVIKTTEREKRNKYGEACEARRATFTPFCVSVDGVMGKQAQHLVKRIGDRLAEKWDRTYGETMGWLRARLAFAILRASILCLRGSRTKWRCLGLEDGAPITWLLD